MNDWCDSIVIFGRVRLHEDAMVEQPNVKIKHSEIHLNLEYVWGKHTQESVMKRLTGGMFLFVSLIQCLFGKLQECCREGRKHPQDNQPV